MHHLIQGITARLQRVTFSTLHKLLGLTSELVKPTPPTAPYEVDRRLAEAGKGANLASVVAEDVARMLGMEVAMRSCGC